MVRKIAVLMILVSVFAGSAGAAPIRESDTIDADPIVFYGKDSNGVLRPVQVDTDGIVQTA